MAIKGTCRRVMSKIGLGSFLLTYHDCQFTERHALIVDVRHVGALLPASFLRAYDEVKYIDPRWASLGDSRRRSPTS